MKTFKSFLDLADLKSVKLSEKFAKQVQPIDEAELSKDEIKMAHTIGKEFEKKGVGDKSKGGAYAVATAMVQDKPEAAKKAYTTIKAKMSEEKDQDALIALYDSLSEENQTVFLERFEANADKMLEFALSLSEE